MLALNPGANAPQEHGKTEIFKPLTFDGFRNGAETVDLALHSREQAVESLLEGRRQSLSPMGQNTLRVAFDHPSGTGHWLERLPGLLPHRLATRAPVPEQLLSFSHILPLVDTLKHLPHLVGHAPDTPFQSHRLPLLGFLLRPVHPVLHPHPPRLFQQIPLPGVTPVLDLPDLVARHHAILGDMELDVHHLRLSDVGTHALDVGRANIYGHLFDSLGMPVVKQQFRSKNLPNRGIPTGLDEEDPLGQQVSEHRQVVVPFAPVHLVATDPDHVAKAQPCMRRFHVGEEHSPNPRVSLVEDLANTLDRHLAHEGHSEGFELLGEVFAASFPRRSHTLISMAAYRMAFGCPLCRCNSPANASQTEASLPGVAKRTRLATRSANTVR